MQTLFKGELPNDCVLQYMHHARSRQVGDDFAEIDNDVD